MKQNLITKKQSKLQFCFFFYCIQQLNAMNDLEI